MVYMEDLVQEEFLEQVKERLGEFRIDGILDSGMLEQLTEDSWLSPFPQYQTTERPDRAAQEILNGKAVLLCDNSPSALILPGVFHSFMESSEDWYNRFEMASFLRIPVSYTHLDVYKRQVREVLERNLKKDSRELVLLIRDDYCYGILNYPESEKESIRRSMKSSLTQMEIQKNMFQHVSFSMAVGAAYKEAEHLADSCLLYTSRCV